MLDESLIGQLEVKEALKCELCGMYFDYDFELDWKSVDETGKCTYCDKQKL